MTRLFLMLRDLNNTITKFLVYYRVDVVITLGLMAVAGSASYLGSGLVNPVINSLEAFDVWFDSDAPRVFDDMVSRLAWNVRADVHPLFALFAYPPVYFLRSVFYIDAWVAVRLTIAGVAALWIAALFILLRCIGLRRNDAVLFSCLAGVSAAAMFWLVIPETLSFGSLTILLALIVVALSCRRALSPAWTVLISVLTLSITISNWIVGLLVTITTHDKKQSIQLTILAVFIVLCLSSLQLLLFPRAVLFGDTRRILAEETNFISRSDSGSRTQSIQSLVFHSIIMPEIKIFDPYWNWLKWKIMRVQLSGVGSGTGWGLAAIPLWCALLGLGIWGLVSMEGQGKTRLVLVGTLVSQLGFHTFYGREPFLYSLHIGPILLVLAAFATLTSLRRISLVLAISLLVLGGINNGIQFGKAIDYFRVYHPSIHRLQSETELPVTERRPDFQKKISLSVDVGSTRMNGYLGPGGSFSPNENSFGLSIWAVNRGDIIATSDTFWPPGAVQEVSWESCGTLPIAKTAVHYFNTKVQVRKAQTWGVSIDQMGNFISRLVVMVRGDGPSGGRIDALDWDGNRLLINNRWILQPEFEPTKVQVGEEQNLGRFVKGGYYWASSKGTGYALFELPETTHNWLLTITDPQSKPGVQVGDNFIPPTHC